MKKRKMNYTFLIGGYVGLVGSAIAFEDHFTTRKLRLMAATGVQIGA
jgi:hypothetical protein